jgi:hypothetical protein
VPAPAGVSVERLVGSGLVGPATERPALGVWARVGSSPRPPARRGAGFFVVLAVFVVVFRAAVPAFFDLTGVALALGRRLALAAGRPALRAVDFLVAVVLPAFFAVFRGAVLRRPVLVRLAVWPGPAFFFVFFAGPAGLTFRAVLAFRAFGAVFFRPERLAPAAARPARAAGFFLAVEPRLRAVELALRVPAFFAICLRSRSGRVSGAPLPAALT